MANSQKGQREAGVKTKRKHQFNLCRPDIVPEGG